ncbi:MAG: hypothetical protein K0R97_725, partial [Oerskovia sp.]|nr:hypothetical protein [Oerskovia sp.]
MAGLDDERTGLRVGGTGATDGCDMRASWGEQGRRGRSTATMPRWGRSRASKDPPREEGVAGRYGDRMSTPAPARTGAVVAVVTVSDRCSRGEAQDRSGPLLAGLAEAA